MKNTKLINLILTIFISTIYADLASPTPFKVKQPNGLGLVIQNRGNHLQGWQEHEGWTVLKNENDWWVYALGNDLHDLIPSNLRVLSRNSMRKEYIEIREKYKKNRFDRFFNEKINLKDALSQGMTESQFKKIDIDNNGFILLSKFNTYNISI